MKYIKEWKLFESDEHLNDEFSMGVKKITDPEEIKRVMCVDKPKKPNVNPKDVTIDGKKFKEISKSEFDILVEWIMENDYVEYYNSSNVKTPDVIKYPSYNNALKLGIYEITGHWLDNPESFLEGKCIFRNEKSDVWWAMEGFRSYHH